ncbi:MAG: 5-methyltetrahydropteroyltriglutamate--homocysteine S-methyltransferase [Rhodospirillales bacterium]|nr:5-methyltetrahydropteroyltriglutamate--homocysteine S-methyltransferase [Rhodospirillales bacterium]
MTIASNLGFPRIGARRALKSALERHWAGTLDTAGLETEAARLRAAHRTLQVGLGISHVPSGEFSLYDHVLDTACLLGAVPPGYGWSNGPVSSATYFALARGTAQRPALPMTKWFDTNYHHLVPQLSPGQAFVLTANRPLDLLLEAKAEARRTRPVLLGPVTFLALSHGTAGNDPLDLLDGVLPVYAAVLRSLAEAGAAWVQIDEPVLALDLPDATRTALRRAYAVLAGAGGPKILLASYFGPIADNLPTALRLPVDGLHLDLVRGAADLDPVLQQASDQLCLSLGVVDGRNVWRTDLRATLGTLRRVADRRGARGLMVAPSCSLLHVPLDLGAEPELAPPLRDWLAFAVQKLAEVASLTRGLDEGDAAIAADLAASDRAVRSRRESPLVHRAAVAQRLDAVTPALLARPSPAPARRMRQRERLALPAFPTTTIGSLPQTEAVRQARAAFARGTIDAAAYDAAIAGWIDEAVAFQEAVGLDVLVHGEFERNDMVKYFGERLDGFAFTKHGWVQSYGSRCVAPPIIWGDAARPAPITVQWSRYAQSRTTRPMKGMLTGPVTLLQWSFVRDDLPRATVCRQIALAVRDEVQDLEAAGIAVIQIDEPAFREGLPLRQADRAAYLDWAVACFRLCSSGVRDDTAIHTHMCYSAFADIIGSIAAMDADAISIETTRSRMALLEAFAQDGNAYPNEIGPGVWDIHSPRVPSAAEMTELLGLARQRLADWQIWVNPDCGLKTRGWPEVQAALANMVQAARTLRQSAG